MRIRIAVGPLRKVPVERRHDRVRTRVVRLVPRPLPDARTASIGHHGAARLKQRLQDSVAFGRIAHLLRTRIDQQLRFRLQLFGGRLTRHRSGAAQILVRRVRTRSDQADFHPLRDPFFAHPGAEFGDRMRGIGRKRPVDIGFQRRQVDFDHPVVIFFRLGGRFGVGAQRTGYAVGQRGHFFASGSAQVARHRLVIGEQRSGGPHLGAHIADRRLAGRRQRSRPVAEIFQNRIGSALDGQYPGQFQDHVFRRSPAAEPPGQFHADDLRHFQLPRHPCHHVHRIGPADADSYHAEPAGVRRMRIRPDHHAARKSVVFQHDLMNDTGPGFPETEPVAIGHAFEKIVHLAVRIVGGRHIGSGPPVGLNQVVAVHRRRNGRTVAAGVHKLQQRHLRRGILHRHAIRTEIHVIDPSAERFRIRRIVQVRIEDFLRQRQRRSFHFPGLLHPGGERAVNFPNQLNVKYHFLYIY